MSIYAAVLGGAMGSVVLNIIMQPLSSVLQTQTIVNYLATLFTPQPNLVLGNLLLLAAGMSLGVVYAALWRSGLGSPGILWGLVYGVGTWIVVGFLIGLLPAVHAGIHAGWVPVPGFYMINVGGAGGFIAGVVGFMMFGITASAVYYGFLTLAPSVKQQ